MTPLSFRLACIARFGERGWQSACARFLERPDGTHVNVRTVRRWSTGATPVPGWVEERLEGEEGGDADPTNLTN